MEIVLVTFISLIFSSNALAGAIDRKIVDDSGYYNGKFLKSPVDHPHVSEGQGKVVDIYEPGHGPHKLAESSRNDQENIEALLGKLYTAITSKLDDNKDSSSSEETLEKSNLEGITNKKEESDTKNVIDEKAEDNDNNKPKKKNFADLENALDILLKSMTKGPNDENKVESVKKENAEKEESKDFAKFHAFTDVKSKENGKTGEKDDKFISFDEFEDIFFHTFLHSDADAQRLVLSGRKDSEVEKKDDITKLDEDEKKILTEPKKKTITELYDELKEETKKEKERLDQEKMIDNLKKEVDDELKKEEALESKKKELVKLLNVVTNSDNFVYEDGRISLNENKKKEDKDEQDFDKLLESTHEKKNANVNQESETRMDKIFLDAFKEYKEKEKSKREREEKEKRERENEDKKRKERLQSLLEDFVDVLKPGKSENKKSERNENTESEKELLKVLEGFDIKTAM